MQNFPTIKTERLLLREIRKSDTSAILDIFSRDEVTEHYDCYPFADESQASNWVNWNISAYEEKGCKGFRWAISLLDRPEQLVGSCGIHSVNQNFYSLEVGYELHPSFWGKGFATEAVAAVINHCFSHDFPVRINRVSATTDIVSPQSVSVLSKLGFKEEGVLREYGFWKDKFHDVRLYSLLRREWALNKALKGDAEKAGAL